ncbi:MAG: RsmE family RNA methyltransferase [Oscillospiraceae bacterium]|nr:RsmE family RNA methyltransferase [Oscillospiraceae bacterium]
MPKFFLSPEEIQDNFMVLTGEQYNHARVLRLKCGDEVTVCDGRGTDFRCTVSDVSTGQISLVVASRDRSRAEPRVFCCVYMAYAKADKFEHVIQKATELGACELVAFPASRCVSKPDEKSLQNKLERWQKIAAAAAEQSGRGLIPRVLTAPSYPAALARASQADLSVLFYENESRRTFRTAIETAPFQTAALMTGPEGGLEPAEVEAAAAAGLQVCTLGTRILRCETAPLCALSALLYAAGEF